MAATGDEDVHFAVFGNAGIGNLRKRADGSANRISGDGDFIPLKASDVSGILQLGGTMLKTARCDAFRTPEGRELAFQQLKNAEIDAVVVIGGDGSFTGALVMSQEFNIPFVGIPATIDNDMFGTDYTIGYETALNSVVEAVDKIRDTARSHGRIFFVEVMGR